MFLKKRLLLGIAGIVFVAFVFWPANERPMIKNLLGVDGGTKIKVISVSKKHGFLQGSPHYVFLVEISASDMFSWLGKHGVYFLPASSFARDADLLRKGIEEIRARRPALKDDNGHVDSFPIRKMNALREHEDMYPHITLLNSNHRDIQYNLDGIFSIEDWDGFAFTNLGIPDGRQAVVFIDTSSSPTMQLYGSVIYGRLSLESKKRIRQVTQQYIYGYGADNN